VAHPAAAPVQPVQAAAPQVAAAARLAAARAAPAAVAEVGISKHASHRFLFWASEACSGSCNRGLRLKGLGDRVALGVLLGIFAAASGALLIASAS
jgi:hypothetical protein